MSKIHQQLYDRFTQVNHIKVHLNDRVAEAVVDEVKEMNAYTEDKKAFSVVIKIKEEAVQDQGAYLIDIEGLDSMQVFMVPIQRNEDSSFYEMVFN